jgi:hypothetical protein
VTSDKLAASSLTSVRRLEIDYRVFLIGSNCTVVDLNLSGEPMIEAGERVST